MKSRRNYILMLLFALIFILGVGYALVSSINLSITGNISASTEELDVYFKSASTESSKVTATVTPGTLSGTINVSDMTLNETVTATYTIENNESDVVALIGETKITNSNPSHFQVTASVGNNNYVCPSKSKTTTVTISVKMIKTPIVESDSLSTIKVELPATPKDPSEASAVC